MVFVLILYAIVGSIFDIQSPKVKYMYLPHSYAYNELEKKLNFFSLLITIEIAFTAFFCELNPTGLIFRTAENPQISLYSIEAQCIKKKSY